MAAYLFSIVWPVALHMILSDVSVILLAAVNGGKPDSALCTALAALLVLPPALWMYHRDCAAVRDDSKRNAGNFDERQKNSSAIRIRMGAVCFVAGGILNHIWSQILLWIKVQDYFSNEVQEQLLASQLAVQILGLGILVPIAEELIFRGLLYGRIRRMLPMWASVLAASAIFALYHGNMIQILFAFPMAIILSLLYEKGKWLGYPVLFHMGVNLTTVVLGALGYG